MAPALARHDEIVRDSIAEHAGHVVKMTGDGVHAVFATASSALDAAVGTQVAIAGESWHGIPALAVRMGLHSGAAELRDGDYYGTVVNSAARLMSIAHGGQVVMSDVTAGLVREVLPADVGLVDLGEHGLRDLSVP